MLDNIDDIRLSAFEALIATSTEAGDCPNAIAIDNNIPIYEASAITAETQTGISQEWANVLSEGAGVFVVKRAFQDDDAIDAATEVFQKIIAEERAEGGEGGDHFAAAGANDRIWNSLQKLCLNAPDVYARYMANPVIDLACRAWLGPGYQMATQLNQVRPGGKAQAPHRDYHLGFMTPEQMVQYPAHIHRMGPTLILQGGVAHSDMPVESGTTKFLPHSQKYLPGYIAATREAFRDSFEAHYVQLPLEKGDAVFFSPALFHAAGENRTTDVTRTVNLIQTASAFARHMESIDRTAMCEAVYPYLAGLSEAERRAVISATADGYPFPTNLDTDPPLGGLAPETQQDLMNRAVTEGWEEDQLKLALQAQHLKRRA
ncbi:phytanoyl-CoA dioxygenase family protein [Celeribacter sp.]|uniref:phytanoyl-CoA dioxygenase family protein n=1 Tax=Celeribacter sp. TaxID=1890673 RepID=UPI003A90403F